MKKMCLLLSAFCLFFLIPSRESVSAYIKWVDCNVSDEVMKNVAKYNLKYHGSQYEFDFCEAIAYLATKNGNNFSRKTDAENLRKLVKQVEEGKKIGELYAGNKYYQYHLEAYNALFAEYIGKYKTSAEGEEQYGVKVFFPFAKGRWYSHYDDFGNSRDFGFKRKHLGHDVMGSIGTPVIAIEGGIVSELGWNRYGGWRIGIRSFDTKRYYYYAHLRKDRPYAKDIKVGDEIAAGSVIGYLGNTGYSDKENQNLQTGKPHLHVGLQLIFDDSQVDGNGEIWVDMYQICKFLSSYTALTERDETTKEYRSLNTKIYI